MNIPSFANKTIQAYRSNGSIGENLEKVSLESGDVQDTVEGVRMVVDLISSADNSAADKDLRAGIFEGKIENLEGDIKADLKKSDAGFSGWFEVQNGESTAFSFIEDKGDSMSVVSIGRDDASKPFMALQHEFSLNGDSNSGYLMATPAQ